MDQEPVLPVIDLERARDPANRLDVARQLVHTLETVGFLYIDNAPGIDQEKLLQNAKGFFQLSPVQKQMLAKNRWNPSNTNKYRGYFPVQTGEISYKEGFEIGQDGCSFDDPEIHPMFTESNLWPRYEGVCEEFKREMQEYYKAILNTGAEVLRLLALGSGLDEYWFESMFLPDTLSTLRLLHYPQRSDQPPQIAVDGDSVLCCSEHSDSGFVTLLSTFHYSGLQIRTPDNKWMDVTPRPNSLVMNIGDILSKLSNGRFKATRHRVVDTLQDRFSVPFFFEPRYSANIGELLPFMQTLNKVIEDKDISETTVNPSINEHKTKYGPWLIGKMQQFVEFKDILIPYPVSTVGV